MTFRFSDKNHRFSIALADADPNADEKVDEGGAVKDEIDEQTKIQLIVEAVSVLSLRL